MTNALIDSLVRRFRSGADCAAALNITKQAFSAALLRGTLSARLALRAAEILEIEPGAALLMNAAQHTPRPETDAAANLPAELHITCSGNTNYAFNSPEKKSEDTAIFSKLHKITSLEREEALDLCRWVYSVANLRPDSPRFAWYVSRWAVPEKIARAKLDGTFAALVSRRLPIDPCWLMFVPAALEARRTFIESTERPIKQNTINNKNGQQSTSTRKAA